MARLCAPGTSHAAWDDGLIWVARGSGEVLRIDATTTDVRGPRLQVEGTPQHVVVHGAHVFVTCRHATQRGQVGPPDQVHIIRRNPEPKLLRSVSAKVPVGVAPLGKDRVAIVGSQIQVVAPSTGAILQTLSAGEGRVNGFHAVGGRLCVSKQKPGRLACFAGDPLALQFDNAGYKWITGVRIDGDRAFVALMTPLPGFGVFDLTTGAFTQLQEGPRHLPAAVDPDGQRWTIRAAKDTQALELVALDAECRPTGVTPIPGMVSPWPRLLHVDAGRAVFHTLRQGAFRFDRK